LMGDTHCGNLLGLTPPGWWNAEQTPPTQRPMWEWYTEELKRIGPVDVLVLNGDLVDGEGKKETIGLLTTDIDEQAAIARACVEPVKYKRCFLTYGTPFHTVGTGSYEKRIADALGAPITDTLLLSVGGVRFNVRHVGGRSDIPYGQGTQLYKEVVRDMLHSVIEEFQSADVVVRSHVHYYLHIERSTKDAISLPCYQVPDSVFARTLRTMYYDIGMVVVEVDKGRVTVDKHLMPLKIVRKREYINV
jgi:hypothetical protein